MLSHLRRDRGASRRPDPGAGRGLSRIAARTLTSEATRHPGPKQVTVLGDDSRVVRAVLEQLAPADRLTVCVATPDRAERLHRLLAADPETSGEARRVMVLHTPPEDAGEPPVDVLVVCDPVTGSAADAHDAILRYEKLLAPQGVVSLVAPLVPRVRGTAAAELRQVATTSGVRHEVVLRSRTPLRVHHLRFTVGDAALAERLAPAWSPTSVGLGGGIAVDTSGMTAATALGAVALLVARASRRPWWVLPAAAAVPVAAYFRDPRRDAPGGSDLVVAAADGTVLSVDRVREEHLGPGEWLRVAVHLSVLDVRVNRSPVPGRVAAVLDEDPRPPARAGTRVRGTATDATPGAARYTVLETTRGRAVVAQRGGPVGRAIVHRAPVGALLARGERFGLIRAGSRTDVYLPAELAEAAVTAGDRVRGAETVIARYRPRPRRRPSPRPGSANRRARTA